MLNWERLVDRDIIIVHMDKYKRFKIDVDGRIFPNSYLVKCDDKKLLLYKIRSLNYNVKKFGKPT